MLKCEDRGKGFIQGFIVKSVTYLYDFSIHNEIWFPSESCPLHPLTMFPSCLDSIHFQSWSILELTGKKLNVCTTCCSGEILKHKMPVWNVHFYCPFKVGLLDHFLFVFLIRSLNEIIRIYSSRCQNVLKMFMIEWLSPVSDALSRGQMKN